MEKVRVTQIPVGATIDFDVHTGAAVFYAGPDGVSLPVSEWEQVTGTHTVVGRDDSTDRTASGPLHGRTRTVTLTLDNGRVICLVGQQKLPVIA